MRFAGKLFVAFILIYYGYGVVENVMAMDEDCLGWECEVVSCHDDYAVWVAEHGAFLPCKDVEEYIKTKDVRLLR